MELMVLWAVVIVALIYMMGFFGRHVKGNVMSQAKSVSADPWGDSATYTSNTVSSSDSVSTATSSTSDSVTNTDTSLTLGDLE